MTRQRRSFTYCVLEDCNRIRANRETGYCQTHHNRHIKGVPFDAPFRSQGDCFKRCVTEGDPDECWEWQGHRGREGYGRLHQSWAHRVSYERYVGPIPDGFHLDHLCRNRACVNPAHLEPVPPRVNFIRGYAPAAIAVNTNLCQRGHEFTEANTYYRPDNGYRQCRECIQMRSQRNSAKRTARRQQARAAA